MSRTAIATLVFEDDGHREAWLEEHGVIPKRHGDYRRVPERVDYEHVRENPVIVFNIQRPERGARTLEMPPLPNAAAHATALGKLAGMSGPEFTETLVRAGTHTPDGQLTPEYRNTWATLWMTASEVPVEVGARARSGPPLDGELPFPGRFHKKLLSALTEPEARALIDALARSAKAEHANKEFVETWRRRVSEWAHYRGWNS